MTVQKRQGLEAFWVTSYFPSLDGLRAICILLVMFNHIHEPGPAWIQGRVGVDIFFVLSGFLITTLLARERERHGNVSLRGFYTRRFFRIVPVYALVVVLYLVVAWLTHDVVRWREFKSGLPYLVTFMQEYRPVSTGLMLGHAWSLGIEEKFYLVWPLLLVTLFPFRWRAMGALLALGVGICLLPALFARSYGGLFLGALLAISLTKTSGDGVFDGGTFRVSVGPALGIIAAGYAAMVGYGLPVLFFSAGITLLVGALLLRGSWLRSLLERPWMVTFGKRSYSMYLIHVLVINSVERLMVRGSWSRWYVVIPAAYLLSFGGATAMYYVVERPCVRYGRKLAAGMRESLTKRSGTKVTLGEIQAIRDPL